MKRYIVLVEWKTQHGKDVNVPQIIYTCNIITFTFTAWFYVNIDKILKFVTRSKVTVIGKIVLKKNKVEGITLFWDLLWSYTNQDNVVL